MVFFFVLGPFQAPCGRQGPGEQREADDLENMIIMLEKDGDVLWRDA